MRGRRRARRRPRGSQLPFRIQRIHDLIAALHYTSFSGGEPVPRGQRWRYDWRGKSLRRLPSCDPAEPGRQRPLPWLADSRAHDVRHVHLVGHDLRRTDPVERLDRNFKRRFLGATER
jgi:hypothetical protein